MPPASGTTGDTMLSERVLVVTNDFGPRAGGIETYVTELLARLDPGRLVVHAPRHPGAGAHDAGLPYPVARDPAGLLLPGPALAARVRATARRHGARVAWFPSAAPLALLSPAVRSEGIGRVVASAHGHEVWWGRAPGTRQLLRRLASGVDVLTVDSATVGRPIARTLPRRARAGMVLLSPGVDASRFRPDADTRAVESWRERLAPPSGSLPAGSSAGRHPMVLCASRMVPRKGHARLATAWPAIRRRHPGAVLALAGTGPHDRAVRRAAAEAGGERAGIHVVGEIPGAELPGWYAAADVFVLPVADRLGGLVTESLGIVLLEAAASGTPVVAGRAGGTAEAVLSGRTGELIDARDRSALVGSVSGLLAEPARAHRLGQAGRRWAAASWSWETTAARLAGLLAGEQVGRWP